MTTCILQLASAIDSSLQYVSAPRAQPLYFHMIYLAQLSQGRPPKKLFPVPCRSDLSTYEQYLPAQTANSELSMHGVKLYLLVSVYRYDVHVETRILQISFIGFWLCFWQSAGSVHMVGLIA